MAMYEIEWEATVRYKTRIQAPPNDERMTDAAVTGEIFTWIKSDVQAEAAVLIASDPVREVKALGMVEADGTVRPL